MPIYDIYPFSDKLYSSEYFFKFMFNCSFAELYRKLLMISGELLSAGILGRQSSHGLRSYRPSEIKVTFSLEK